MTARQSPNPDRPTSEPERGKSGRAIQPDLSSDSPRGVSANRLPPTGRLAGIDYGTKRIGIALCDPGRRIASPLENYTRRDLASDAARFRRLVAEEAVVGFVVGLPVHASGDESAKSLETRRFGQWLVQTTERPVVYVDERYTSAEAESLLLAAGHTKKRRKERLDKLAAQMILASFLERGRLDEPSPGSLDG